MAQWGYDPHSGGVKIPERVQQRTRHRILAYAEQHYAGKYTRLDVRFRGQFCYIDAYTEPHVPPDPDVPLDLGAVVQAVYERGGYATRIDYLQPVPPPALEPEEQAWVEHLLAAHRQ